MEWAQEPELYHMMIQQPIEGNKLIFQIFFNHKDKEYKEYAYVLSFLFRLQTLEILWNLIRKKITNFK